MEYTDGELQHDSNIRMAFIAICEPLTNIEIVLYIRKFVSVCLNAGLVNSERWRWNGIWYIFLSQFLNSWLSSFCILCMNDNVLRKLFCNFLAFAFLPSSESPIIGRNCTHFLNDVHQQKFVIHCTAFRFWIVVVVHISFYRDKKRIPTLEQSMLFSNFCCCRIWYWQYVQFMGALLVVVHFIHELNKRKLSHSFFTSIHLGRPLGLRMIRQFECSKTFVRPSFHLYISYCISFFFSPRKRTIHIPNSEGF